MGPIVASQIPCSPFRIDIPLIAFMTEIGGDIRRCFEAVGAELYLGRTRRPNAEVYTAVCLNLN